MKNALLIKTDGTVENIDLIAGHELSVLQNAVDGLVQAVSLTPTITMWVNEEGKMYSHFQSNENATQVWRWFFGYTDSIMGNAVFTGGADSDGETVELSVDDERVIREMISQGE
jgi:hypothetical protein